MKRGGCYSVADGVGFTIVEVMIVLAVSGMLLISAIALINGRQDRTEFTTAVNDEQQQLEQIINETASGYYPNERDFTCTGNPGGAVSFTVSSPGSTTQGTNGGCIFLGNALQFGTSASDQPDPTQYSLLPVVGNAYQLSGGNLSPVTQLGQAAPRALYPASSADSVPSDDITGNVMEYGLQLATGNNECEGLSNTSVCYLSGSNYLQTGIAAFVAGDSSGSIAAADGSSDGGLESGSQQLSLYAVKSPSASGDTLATAATNIGNVSGPAGTGGLVSASKILICMASGGTNQSGLFTISGTGSLSVTLQIMSDLTC